MYTTPTLNIRRGVAISLLYSVVAPEVIRSLMIKKVQRYAMIRKRALKAKKWYLKKHKHISKKR